MPSDISMDPSEAKIFGGEKLVLEERILLPSLGHRILDKLGTDRANEIVYVDVASGREWTGKSLKERILNVAIALIDKHQFEKGTFVCVNYDNSDLLLILSLAIICAGGAVSTPFYKNPYNEVLYLARRVEPKLFFCPEKKLQWSKQLSSELGYEIQGIAMDGDANSYEPFRHFQHFLDYDHRQSKSLSLVPVPCRDTSREIAMTILSSGTTGKPKAVPMTHKNCLIDLKSNFCDLSKRAICPCISSLDYVTGRLILLGAIENGYTALILNGFEPKQYLEAAEKYRATSLFLGTAAFYAMITYKDVNHYDLSSAIKGFSMGAKMNYIDELREFCKNHPNLKQMMQGYGATEISGGAVCTRSVEEYLKDPDNCGKLMPGMKAKVVHTETGELLGRNQQGELRILGRTTFPGYYDAQRARENGNSTSFFGDSTVFDEDGFYLTGDIVYFNEKDELYVVGREKERMSCKNAKKVLPQEIEVILSEHPAVSEVCVLGIPNSRLISIDCPRAFIVPKANCYVDKEIKLSERLPSNCDFPIEEEVLEHKGNHTLTKLETEKRRLLAEDIMKFANERISDEKSLTGGIVILDQLQTLRSGKIDKSLLRSLTTEQVEMYGDRS